MQLALAGALRLEEGRVKLLSRRKRNRKTKAGAGGGGVGEIRTEGPERRLKAQRLGRAHWVQGTLVDRAEGH